VDGWLDNFVANVTAQTAAGCSYGFTVDSIEERPALELAGPVNHPRKITIDTNRLGDVLDLLDAEIHETVVDHALDLLEHTSGNADAVRFGPLLQARHHIDTVAEDVVGVDDYVAEIDPNAQHDPGVG